jgi:hypothetical protein
MSTESTNPSIQRAYESDDLDTLTKVIPDYTPEEHSCKKSNRNKPVKNYEQWRLQCIWRPELNFPYHPPTQRFLVCSTIGPDAEYFDLSSDRVGLATASFNLLSWCKDMITRGETITHEEIAQRMEHFEQIQKSKFVWDGMMFQFGGAFETKEKANEHIKRLCATHPYASQISFGIIDLVDGSTIPFPPRRTNKTEIVYMQDRLNEILKNTMKHHSDEGKEVQRSLDSAMAMSGKKMEVEQMMTERVKKIVETKQELSKEPLLNSLNEVKWEEINTLPKDQVDRLPLIHEDILELFLKQRQYTYGDEGKREYVKALNPDDGSMVIYEIVEYADLDE